MPLVPPQSSSLFRPISHDKPWHTLLHNSTHMQSSSTITPPESSLSQQSPPPSPPRSIASSTSTSSISVSLEPVASFPTQYHTSASSANNQTIYSAPSNHTNPSSDHVSAVHPNTHTPSPPHVVRFTAEHVTIASPQRTPSRKTTALGTRDFTHSSADEYSPVRPRNEVMRIRPTHTPTSSHDTTPTTTVPEGSVVVRDQNDLLADLKDLSNMLTDHIDVTKGFVKSGERGRRSGTRFIKRILSKVRPVRSKERERAAAEQAAVATAAEAAVKGDIRYSSGIRDASDELRQLVKVGDDVFGEYGDDLDDECWSESELQSLNSGKRQYMGFTRRNDTDIEARAPTKVTALRRGRSGRYHADTSRRPQKGRRRSMDHGQRAEERGRLTRMSKSTVVVGKDWEDLSKGRTRLRLRMKGSHMDRRADRSDVERRGGDVWGRWKDDVTWGREHSVVSMPAGDLSKEFLTRADHSFRSADSSVGALSVSSITQASRTSSIN